MPIWSLSEVMSEPLLREIIRRIGDDPDRAGLKETPTRVIRSWEELFSGYKDEADLKTILKLFEEDHDEMVILRDVEFYSMCEHHMIPFYGRVHIGYLPMHNQVPGLSKLARLVEVFARRLQVQERMTRQIAEALMEHVLPAGAGVVVEAKHLCVCGRGVGKQQSEMITSAMRGSFRTDAAVRNEFLGLIGKRV